MSDNFGKRKRGGKRDRGTPRLPIRRPPSEEPAPLEHLTQEEYERKKTDILRRAVLAESQYIALRTQLRDNKFREAREYKANVAAGTDPELLAAKREAEDALSKKLDINQAKYELKMAQILDEYEAETAMNETQHEDKYVYAKGRYIDFFKELIAEKEKREREVGMLLGAYLTLPPLGNETTEKPVFKDVVFKGRHTRSRSKSQKQDDESVPQSLN